MTLSDYVAIYAAILATATALGGVYLYFKNGPKLSVRIVPPDPAKRDNRITLVITNVGNATGSVHTIIWRIYRFEKNVAPSLIREAKFGDKTPYKPRISIEPNQTQYLPFKFFPEWQTEKSMGFIEVEIFQERSTKSLKKRFVATDELIPTK